MTGQAKSDLSESRIPASEYDALIELFVWLAERSGELEHEIEIGVRQDFGQVEAQWVADIFNGQRAAELFDA